jgi:leucyl/phenylalanyl-tRNA---protein transferase
MPKDPGPCEWELPDPSAALPGEDCIGIGADLEPSTLVHAYSSGIFPMDVPDAVGRMHLGWWSPDPRGILPLDAFRVTRSMRQSAKRFTVTVDQDFAGVMQACMTSPRGGGWIDERFVNAYGRLHEMGWAHSVECWRDGQLAGGLYGVEIGGLFAGESMFHRERDASKVALMALVERLRLAGGDRLLDVQWCTEHLATMGAAEVTREEYRQLLERALELQPCFGS